MPVLIIQVVHIPLVWIHMGDVTLPVHVSLVFARHLVPPKGFSWLMQFEAAVVDHGATMVNMTAPSS
jgi:hypothetical protein